MSTLAQRADGVLIVAGQIGLDAVSPRGRVLWHVPLGTTQWKAPSVAVDAAGTVYVGCGDGLVRIFSAGGRLLTTLGSGPASIGSSPVPVLGPEGRLVVNGTDGVLRVYG